MLKGGRVAVAGCFVVLLLIPGVLPRYVQPLAAPFNLLLATVIWEMPERARRWWRLLALGLTVVVIAGVIAGPFVAASAASRGAEVMPVGVAALVVIGVSSGALVLFLLRRRMHETVHLALWTGLIAMTGILLYSCAVVPWVRLKETVRPFAGQIDEVAADRGEVIAYDTWDDAPLLATLFYLRAPFRYATAFGDAPAGTRVYLVPARRHAEFIKRFRVIGEPLVSNAPAGSARAAVVWAERLP
jgi:4-amino-4-deoxy-L-arabinose transferase-like glycosyltransferase